MFQNWIRTNVPSLVSYIPKLWRMWTTTQLLPSFTN